MSVLNQSGEEQVECPLCMEPLEVDDLHFYPCTCGYQICRFCWNRIREGENGLCPACRKAYPENPADFTPLSQEQVAAIKTEKRAREAKRRNKTLESRRALANVRVVQNNLVFVVGLPVRLADPEILKRQEYFGKYGKIHKVVINQSTTYAGSQGPSASAYVTYVSPADALRAIQGVNNVTLDGRVLKGSLGTTKYCANFMKNQPCPKPDCMYLHELGDPKASFTKEEMHAGLHQVYERKLHNQLLQQQRDRPVDEKQSSNTGNSSTIAEKGSQKDGNQSNFIPTTVVTSSHINNVVNSSKSKKESVNGNSGNSNGNSSSSSSNGKEAWPSLGSSPPSDSPARKQPSPKPTVKSQENCTSESSSPTQQSQQQQAQMKNSKDINHTENGSKSNRSNRDASITNGQTSKRNKIDKSKQKNGNSINNSHNNNSNDISEMEDSKQINDSAQNMITDNHTYEHDTQHELQQNQQQQQQQQQSFLSSELDELESDRHSLLESRSPSLGERGLLDDEPHALLDGLEARLRSRPTLNGYTLPDREIIYAPRLDLTPLDRKELLLREQRRNEMIIRQNELLARHHAQSVLVDPKHYMPTSNIGLDSTSELLGANFHSNPNMLPPFGMRIDNSMATNPLGANSLSANALTANSLAANSLTANSMSASGLSGNPLVGAGLATGYLPHPQQILQNQQQIPQTGLVNGFDAQPNANEGRYLAENMEKFFTDFHKTQQMRLLLSRGAGGTEERRYAEPQALHYPHNMLSAERLEMEHKQRMNSMLVKDMGSGRASGDRDDDLDFDPIKETQKAFTEMMETEMMQNTVSSGDSMDRSRRCRLPPPGFGHMNAVNAYSGLGVSRPQIHHQGISSYNSSNAIFSDWTQMDPAIVSTSVNFGKGAPQPQPATTLSQQQRELFARFNHLSVQQPNGVSKLHAPGQHAWPASAAGAAGPHKWGAAAYANIPLPPGFAPAKPPQHPAECIDAK